MRRRRASPPFLAPVLLVALLATPAFTAALANGAPAGPVTRFVAVGDMGTGGSGQYAVAAAIRDVCEARGCDFAISLGDNIYDYGAYHPYDAQFEEKFELPYAELAFPFHLTLGNHDVGGAMVTPLGENQVLYSMRTDRLSDKWRMPARYYDFVAGPVHFFALDTNLPPNAAEPRYAVEPTPAGQGAWLDAALDGSTAPWRIAYGHHPYVSNGQHGDASSPYRSWVEEHVCDRVDFLTAGHDHDLQWIAPVDACGRTEFLVSGAAAKTRGIDGLRHESRFARGSTLGFLWAEATEDAFHGVFFDKDGRTLYERTMRKE